MMLAMLETTMPALSLVTTAEPAAAPDAGLGPDMGLGPGFDAWRAFIVSHAIVTRRLDDELRTEHGIALGEYDALVQLAYAEGRTLRMSALADRVLLSRSGVTRLVDRLVADGLVRRVSCPSDARGSFAVLTDTGLARLRAASVTHLRGVREHFLSQLTAEQRDEVAAALDRVVAHAAEPVDLAGCAAHEATAPGGLAVRLETPNG